MLRVRFFWKREEEDGVAVGDTGTGMPVWPPPVMGEATEPHDATNGEVEDEDGCQQRPARGYGTSRRLSRSLSETENITCTPRPTLRYTAVITAKKICRRLTHSSSSAASCVCLVVVFSVGLFFVVSFSSDLSVMACVGAATRLGCRTLRGTLSSRMLVVSVEVWGGVVLEVVPPTGAATDNDEDGVDGKGEARVACETGGRRENNDEVAAEEEAGETTEDDVTGVPTEEGVDV